MATETAETDALIDVDEAAELLGVGCLVVYGLRAAGQLPEAARARGRNGRPQFLWRRADVTRLAENRLLRTPDVCRRLALSRDSVLTLVRSGELPALQVTPGGHWRYRLADVEAFVATRPRVNGRRTP